MESVITLGKCDGHSDLRDTIDEIYIRIQVLETLFANFTQNFVSLYTNVNLL